MLKILIIPFLAPSGPPENVQAVTNSSSSIILYWLPPNVEEQNGKITSYNIKMTSNTVEKARNVSTMTNATTFAFSRLRPYTSYSFMVRAVTKGGVGPFSHVASNTTLEAGKVHSLAIMYYTYISDASLRE